MEHNNNNLLIYKSSAGSGKTTTLVYEYLSIILPQPDKFSKILAVTFTNKAANEMKQRIINYLYNIITPGHNKEALPPQYHQLLSQKLDKSNKDIKKQASVCLNKIIHNYSDFAVSTIDSFIYRVIRGFARDLDLPWDFEVEMDTEEIFQQIIDMMMEDFGKDKFMTRQIMALVRDKLTEGKSWRFEKEIREISRKLLESEKNTSFVAYATELDNEVIEAIRKEFRSENKELLGKAQQTAYKAFKLISDHNLSIDDFAHKKSGIGNYLYKISTTEPEKVFKGNKNVEKNINDHCLYSKSQTDELKERIDLITDEIIALYEKLNQIKDQASEYYGREVIAQNLHVVAILKNIKQTYEEIKQDNAILPISEFAKRISEVTLSEDIPYIYERLGERYQHFFIDEFQDTSTLQWENMLPLIENALSYNNLNLIVGDVKQAIYRFRGGNIDQLAKIPEPPQDITSPFSLNRYQAIKTNATIKPLNVNYRSKKEIVTFNNTFFDFVKSQLNNSQQTYYDNITQEYNDSSGQDEGYVQIQMSDDKNDHFEKTLQIIQDLRNDRYSFKDITILCRKNQDAQDIAVFLMGQTVVDPQSGELEQIRVISDESLTLKQSKDVNTLISFARLLEIPDDKVEITNILRYFYEKNPKRFSFHSWYSGIIQNTGWNINEILGALETGIKIARIHQYDLYSFFEYLAEKTGMDNMNNSYLQFFFDELHNFTKTHHIPTLDEFVKWWDDKGKNKSIISPEGIDAIQIKTIHKSKGLSFPVVIYPYAVESATNFKKADYTWVDTADFTNDRLKTGIVKLQKNQLENSRFLPVLEDEINASTLDMINTLYVCMTRPKERLYIISSKVTNKTGHPLQSLKHLFTAYFDHNQIEDDILAYPLKPQPKKLDKKPKESIETQNHFNFQSKNSWPDRIAIKKPRLKNIHPVQNPKTEGTIMHYYLSLIQYEDDIPSIKTLIKSDIEEEQAEWLCDTIEQVVKNPKLQSYFQKQNTIQVKNEAELLTGGEIYRPDRIVIQPDSVIVIEYKTGDFRQEHEQQVKKYAASIESIYQQPVFTLLVYIGKAIIIHEVN